MQEPAFSKRFFQSTRGRIIALLRRAGRTVNELAEALELTDNAVRAHLTALERDGLVQQNGQRRGTRKPNNAYDLTPEAERLFLKAYGPFLQQLLGVLGDRLSPEELDGVLREVGHRIAAGHRSAFEGRALSDRMEQARELLGELGGLVEIQERDGHPYLQGYSCPMAAVVTAHPEACRIAEALLAELLDVPVQECCEKGEMPRCCFAVAAPGHA